MHSKRAIELSLDFIVIIIIALVIFSFGVWFISNLSKEAADLTELTTDQLDEMIKSLACSGYDRVCTPESSKTISRKKFGVFGINIFNVLNDQNFDIIVSYPNPLGYTKSQQPITGPPLTIYPASRKVFIKQNDEAKIAIGVQVPENAKSGQYIFNVEIRQSGSRYVDLQKFYVEVP